MEDLTYEELHAIIRQGDQARDDKRINGFEDETTQERLAKAGRAWAEIARREAMERYSL